MQQYLITSDLQNKLRHSLAERQPNLFVDEQENERTFSLVSQHQICWHNNIYSFINGPDSPGSVARSFVPWITMAHGICVEVIKRRRLNVSLWFENVFTRCRDSHEPVHQLNDKWKKWMWKWVGEESRCKWKSLFFILFERLIPFAAVSLWNIICIWWTCC